MKKLVKTVAEFAEHKMICEALMLGGPIEIPGLNFVTANIVGDEIILTTESGRVYPIDMKFMAALSADDDSCTPQMVHSVNKLFQAALISKVDSWLPKKIDVLKQAEGYELFSHEIDKGGFFSELEEDLISFGMSIEDVAVLTGELFDFYTKGHIDNMTPDGLAVLREYLDYWMEVVASKAYIFLQYLNNEAWVDQPTQGQDVDQTTFNNNTNTKNDPKQFSLTNEMLTLETVNIINEMKTDSIGDSRSKGVQGADMKSNLKMIYNIAYQAAHRLSLKLMDPFDFATNRDVIPTTKIVVFPVVGQNLFIKAILEPIELKHKTGGANQTFSIEDQDGFIGPEFEKINGLDNLVKSLKILL